ncbi:MAG TPA: carboxypeptidase regulatory-like domain-containing protein [Candidatus Sulfotelmatobacter sp.]|nr:carboxypeptidase regulatory-like domain-containing protein [Candidatus Sulfotelmatobacter sp.]
MQTRDVLQSHFLSFGFFLLVSATVLAQDTATLTGTVRDNSGAVIPGAVVTMKHIATGTARQLTANSAGEYVAAALVPGQYDLTIAASGFRTYQAHTVTLRVAQNARIDVTLQVGSETQQVMVQGEGLAQVDTESSQLGGTVTGKELVQLQLNGRNFTQLITLVPGVSNQTGQDEGVVGVEGSISYSVNGGRTEYNNWEVDGGDMMDNGSNFSLNVYPSVEAIQEVQVLTSNYGAQYGKNGSGTVEVETKSGTNAFHGSVWEFARNEAFNAHNYFDVPGTPKAGYKKHDFGYSAGGPIWKNHTFFFWLQNWRRENVPQNFYTFVPSVDNRNGDFNDVCNVGSDCPVDPSTGSAFPNNQLPFIDPNAQILLPMIPEPNVGTGANSIFAAAVGQPTHWREELIRLDHDFNSRNRLTFRAIHDSWDTIKSTVTWGGETFPTIGTHFTGPGVEMVARLTSTVSPTLLNEFVASYTTDHIQQINTNASVWTRTSDFTMPGLFPDFGGKLPGLCLSTNGAYNGGFCEGPTAFPWENSNPTFTYRDNVTMSLGLHKFVFGGYFMNAEKNEMAYTDLGGDLYFDSTFPVSTGNAFADLLMGNIASFSQASSQPKYHINFKIFEPYFQDDYHIFKNLTLNLGIRISLYGTFWERNHLISNWTPSAYDPTTAPQLQINDTPDIPQGAIIPGTGNPFDGMVQCGVNGVPRGCLQGHLFNPAPRLGFSWDPLGSGKMAVRAGYGVFFEHTNGMEANAEDLEGTPPIVQTPTQYNISGYANVGGQGLLFPLSTTSIPDRAVWPYVQQWHLDLQRDLGRNSVATLAYVGAKGTHLTLQHELNQLPFISADENPFQTGQPITDDICNSQAGTVLHPTFLVNGRRIRRQPAVNLAVACGNNPDLFRINYPGLGSIQRVEPLANSNYNAFQFSLRKTSGALTLDLAYTYSHSLDNSSDNVDSNFVNSSDLHANYATSNYDQRHILNVAWTYDVPFRGKGFSKSVLGGWQYAGIMTAQAGTPFSVVNGVYGDSAGVADGTTGVGSYADRVGDPYGAPICPSLAPDTKGVPLYNCSAFSQTQGLTFGNSGRNSLRNPRRINFDMSIHKVFKPIEKLNVQFRAEAFNIFNHTEWTGVNPYVSTTNFMYTTGAHMPRVLQFALRLTF